MDELDVLTNEVEAVAEAPPVEPETETGVTGVPPAPESDPVAPHVPVAALLDEREKRQALEQELAAYRQNQIARPDANEDPEGAVNHMENIVNARLWELRASLSRDIVAQQYSDYAEKETAFLALAEESPQLVTDMMASDNPARFAYDTARKREEWQAMQNIDDVKARMRAELKAELLGELEQEANSNARREAGISAATDTPSLATAGDAGTGFVGAGDDDDLSNIALGDNY